MERRLAKKRERRTCNCEWIWRGVRGGAWSVMHVHGERERSERTIEIDPPAAA